MSGVHQTYKTASVWGQSERSVEGPQSGLDGTYRHGQSNFDKSIGISRPVAEQIKFTERALRLIHGEMGEMGEGGRRADKREKSNRKVRKAIKRLD